MATEADFYVGEPITWTGVAGYVTTGVVSALTSTEMTVDWDDAMGGRFAKSVFQFDDEANPFQYLMQTPSDT
jgi:hypothetical protein